MTLDDLEREWEEQQARKAAEKPAALKTPLQLTCGTMCFKHPSLGPSSASWWEQYMEYGPGSIDTDAFFE